MKLKRIILLLLTVMFSFSYGEVFAKDGNSLKKALKNKFLIGVSVNTHQSSGKDVAAKPPKLARNIRTDVNTVISFVSRVSDAFSAP